MQKKISLNCLAFNHKIMEIALESAKEAVSFIRSNIRMAFGELLKNSFFTVLVLILGVGFGILSISLLSPINPIIGVVVGYSIIFVFGCISGTIGLYGYSIVKSKIDGSKNTNLVDFVKQNFVKYLSFGIISTVTYLTIIVPGLVISIYGAVNTNPAIILLGEGVYFFCLLIMMVVVFLLYFAMEEFFFENRTVIESYKRSYQLVMKNKLNTFGALIISSIAISIVLVPFYILLFVIGAIGAVSISSLAVGMGSIAIGVLILASVIGLFILCLMISCIKLVMYPIRYIFWKRIKTKFM